MSLLTVGLIPREQGEVMIDKREESLFLSSQKRAEWFKMALAERWYPPRKSIHHWQRHSPTYPAVGSAVEVCVGTCPWDENIVLSWTEVKFKITLMRPSSRSWLCGFILKGLVQDLLSLLLKDGLSLSRVSRVPLCSPLSISWVCVVCSLHLRMMDPRDNTCNFNCSKGS